MSTRAISEGMCFCDAQAMCCLPVHGSLFIYNGSQTRDGCIDITIVGMTCTPVGKGESGKEGREGGEREGGRERVRERKGERERERGREREGGRKRERRNNGGGRMKRGVERLI